MIHVIAIITAKPGLRAALLEAFAGNRANVLAEKGCIEYFATIDAAGLPPSKGGFGEDTFVVLEKWEDMTALQAHGAAPHMAAFGAKTKELAAARVIHILEAA